MMKCLTASLAALVCLGLAACGEKPQTSGARKTATPAYEGPATAFTAPGWKPGDKAAWTDELRTRAQGQNEYVRIGPGPAATH